MTLEVHDFLVKIKTKDDSFEILKIEHYVYETCEYLEVTSLVSQKVIDYLYEKISEILTERKSEAI